MTEWVWVSPQVLRAIHDRQLAEHGGVEGGRDPGGLESALARPLNLVAYGTPDAAALAAALGCGLLRNHPCVDGNKRTAWVAMRLFLKLNGQTLTFDGANAVTTVLEAAAGTLSEDALAAWLRERLK